MRRFMLCASTVLGLVLASGVVYAAEDECTAKIVGTLMREEGKETKTVFTAKIDVAVEAACAVVNFDIVVVEEESGGKQTDVRIPKEVKLRGSSPTSLKVDYELKPGRSIVSHRFEQTSCKLCEG